MAEATDGTGQVRDSGRPDPARAPLRADAVRSALLVPAGPLHRCAVVATVGSTSTELLARLRADGGWADGGLLVAERQEAGRGRAGHTWTTPPGAALTLSLAVRPSVAERHWGWLPLLTGLGVARAIRSETGLPAVLKWPNDVLVPAVDGAEVEGWGPLRKVVGILAEVAPAVSAPAVPAGPAGMSGPTGPSGPSLVLGIGVNVSQTPDELPVPSAGSLRAAGATDLDRERLLVAVVRSVLGLLDEWSASDGDVVGTGLDRAVADACVTLGGPIRATLPDGTEMRGVAERIDDGGALLVRDADGTRHTLLAGDVRHVRPTGELGSSA